jgi:hypothetical protein
VLDFDLSQEAALIALQQQLDGRFQVPCLVLVDNEGQREAAKSAGADIFHIEGDIAVTLLKSTEDLSDRNMP